jgi:hypothetical protein
VHDHFRKAGDEYRRGLRKEAMQAGLLEARPDTEGLEDEEALKEELRVRTSNKESIKNLSRGRQQVSGTCMAWCGVDAMPDAALPPGRRACVCSPSRSSRAAC